MKRSSSTRRYWPAGGAARSRPASWPDRSFAALIGGCSSPRRPAPSRRHLPRRRHRQPVEGAPVVGDRVLAHAVQPATIWPRSRVMSSCSTARMKTCAVRSSASGAIPDAGIDVPIDRHHLRVVDLLEAAALARFGIRSSEDRDCRHLRALRGGFAVAGRDGAEGRQQGRDLLEEARSVSSKAAGSVPSMSISPMTSALGQDRHHDLAAGAREAGEVARIGVHVVDDLGLRRTRRPLRRSPSRWG